MMKLIRSGAMILGFILLLIPFVHSQTFNLDSPHTLQPSESQKIIWDEISIFPDQKKLVVKYRWVTPGGADISVFGRAQQEWVCRDIVITGANATCVSAGVPDPCCTGLGTGTCDDDDLCFSDIFTFPIPGGAVGQPIGTLVKNAWRDRTLSGGNDGTFE
jgi:hypothetical protein